MPPRHRPPRRRRSFTGGAEPATVQNRIPLTWLTGGYGAANQYGVGTFRRYGIETDVPTVRATAGAASVAPGRKMTENYTTVPQSFYGTPPVTPLARYTAGRATYPSQAFLMAQAQQQYMANRIAEAQAIGTLAGGPPYQDYTIPGRRQGEAAGPSAQVRLPYTGHGTTFPAPGTTTYTGHGATFPTPPPRVSRATGFREYQRPFANYEPLLGGYAEPPPQPMAAGPSYGGLNLGGYGGGGRRGGGLRFGGGGGGGVAQQAAGRRPLAAQIPRWLQTLTSWNI